MAWNRTPPLALKPLRDELLSIERLEERARALAARFTLDPNPRRAARNVLPRFDDNARVLRDAYIALVRGAASGDETVRQVFDETRTELANRVLKHLDVLGLPTHPRTEIAVRGWVAFCEEVVITWLSATGDSAVSREELLTLLANALPGVVLNVDPQWITDLS